MFSRISIRLVVESNHLRIIRSKSKLSYLHNVGEEPLRPLTFGLLLEDTVRKHGDKCALISRHQNKKISFHQVLDQADRLAAGLINIGFHAGDHVGLWAPNLIEWYIANMTCARAGFVLVCINPAYQPREVDFCIKKVGIKGIICGHKFKTQNYYEFLKAICPELAESEPGKLNSKHLPSLKSVVTITDETLRGTHNFNEILDLADEKTIKLIKNNQNSIKIDDPCNIMFSSGTTGQPKAIVISHFNIVNNGFYVGKRNEQGKKHHTICVLVPFFHAFGIVITISAALNYGSTLLLPAPSFDPNKTLDALKEERCTMIHGTPTMYVDLVHIQKERKEKIFAEIAVSGGAICPQHLFKDMLKVLKLKKVKSVYGLSETTAVIFQSLYEDDELKSTSTVGYIQEHAEAKVVDLNGHIVPVGTPGELCIRGYFTMLGYWQDEEKTKQTIGPDRWLKTGDQFVIDEDGYGKVVGRIKELIIRGGENIYPREIEEFLNLHPDILESYIIGVPHERLGEEVCACVRLVEGRSITLDEIKRYCKGNLAHFKIPSALLVVENFPKTQSGKIQKFKLLEQVQNNKSNKKSV